MMKTGQIILACLLAPAGWAADLPPAAAETRVAALEQQCVRISQRLECQRQLKAIAEAVRNAIAKETPEARQQALAQAAGQLQAVTADPAVAGEIRAFRVLLEKTVARLAPTNNVTVITVTDEQQNWERIAKRLAAPLQQAGTVLDAARLILKSSRANSAPATHAKNLLQAESVMAATAVAIADQAFAAETQRSLVQIRLLLAAEPLPKTFTDAAGIEFILVPGTPAVKPFYLSRTNNPPAPKLPAPKAGIEETVPRADSYQAASLFCRRLSAAAGMPYAMPTLVQLTMAAPDPTAPLWSSTPAEIAPPFAQAMRQRFGVQAMALWDPAKLFAPNPEELTAVPNPRIAFRLLLGAEDVRKAWYAQLRKELTLPGLNGQMTEAKP